jgi:hypothetical protein
VVEGFSRMLKKASSEGKFSGIKVAKGIAITHLLFVDDVVILGFGSVEEWIELKQLLSVFFEASGMEVNFQKCCFLFNNIEDIWNTYSKPGLWNEIFRVSFET